MNTENLESLFSQALGIARQKIDSEEFFEPFILAVDNASNYSIFISEETHNDISDFIRDFASKFMAIEEMVAFAFVQLSKELVEEAKVEMDAISVHFETKGGEAMSAIQLFGKNEDGQWLFAEIDAKEAQPIIR